MKVIGFAGTAKNTGKTTTASRLLKILRLSGHKIALTSIGYDGEDIDNVTGLPKPLYELRPGDLIATASDCLKIAPAGSYQVLQETNINTILGKIQIAEVAAETKFVLAGPNRRTDIELLLSFLDQFSPSYVFVDGALNRIVPMIATQGLVLATGGSFDDDIATIVRHARALSDLFQFPVTAGISRYTNVAVRQNDGAELIFAFTSVLAPSAIEELAAAVDKGVDQLIIPGACYPELLEQLAVRLSPREIVLGNPLFLAASGDPLKWQELFQGGSMRGVKISYLETIPLLFMTVNPFYPRFVQATHQYYKAYIDADALLAAMREAITSTPVINIETASDDEILNLIERGETHES